MNISELDAKHIWHPLTQHQTATPPIAIKRALGAVLYGEDGREYIDGIASWYTAVYGHCHPEIIKAVSAQMQQLDQVVFTGFTHAPAAQLAQELFEILPSNQQKMFFNDNGSTAVEAGIKMALQYHFNKGQKRNVLIALEDGFHGDTFGAMSVSGLSVYNGPFEDYFLKVVRIPTPKGANNQSVAQTLRELIATYDCAAFVYEPLVQGAAGMKMYDIAGLQLLLDICKVQDIITIADEVMTGFGKTGKHFASLHLQSYPDIMCLSKALTAGMLPMSLTTCSQHIYDAFLDEEVTKGFFHAHTYSANPLACAAAIAGINLLKSDEIQQRIKAIEQQHHAFAKALHKHPKASGVRVKGVILALELEVAMERYGHKRQALYDYFMNLGVCLRPLGNTIYVLPPYVITDTQLKKIYKAVEKALDHF